MTHASPAPESAAEPRMTGRAGSASADPSGSRVVAAWVASLVVHGLAIAVMFLLVFPFAPGRDPPPVIEAQVVGDIDANPEAATPSSDWLPAASPAEAPTSRFVPEATAAAEALERVAQPTLAKEPELSIIGIGAGGGDAGDLSKYGLSASGGAAPQFFGAGGSVRGVRSVVYVVDRSGSMTDTFPHVRQELKRSIDSLRRSQKFHVVFFSSGEIIENPPGRLVHAVTGNREAFYRFLETVHPSGGTRPENALRRALSMSPDLIYFLSDGINFDVMLPTKLDEWNAERRTRIFTIAYLDPGGRQMLERIARDHGGEFKFVSEYDLP